MTGESVIKAWERFVAAGLEYYNSLVMLEFLLYCGKVSPAAHPGYRASRPAPAARYSPRVPAWAGELHQAVLKYRE